MRYYSHYTFIYPNIYLANSVVETNKNNEIIKIFSFEKEIANTIFHSGTLAFFPENIVPSEYSFCKSEGKFTNQNKVIIPNNIVFQIYDENGNKLIF